MRVTPCYQGLCSSLLLACSSYGKARSAPFSGTMGTVALTFAVATSVSGLIMLLAILVDSTVSLVYMFKTERRDFLAEIERDMYNADLFNRFDIKIVELAKLLLELKIGRSRDRIAMFIGSPDKLALFAVVGLVWTVSPYFAEHGGNVFNVALNSLGLGQLALVVLFASLAGILLGAIYTNVRSQRDKYRIDILTINLKKRP